jgi:hypothetical protein
MTDCSAALVMSPVVSDARITSTNGDIISSRSRVPTCPDANADAQVRSLFRKLFSFFTLGSSVDDKCMLPPWKDDLDANLLLAHSAERTCSTSPRTHHMMDWPRPTSTVWFGVVALATLAAILKGLRPVYYCN